MNTTTKTSLNVHVPGSRLQPTCRKLGIQYRNHFSHWEPNHCRRYPDRAIYDGVNTTPEGAAKLAKYFADKAAKEESRRYRRWLELHQPKELIEDQRQKKNEAQHKRTQRELQKIKDEVLRRWELDAIDLHSFAVHANEPGEGRVLRTRTACTETFEHKVYMALVAWVRHNKTDYEDKLDAAKDAAYAEYNDMRPDFDAGERWSDSPYSREETEWALGDARSAAREARNHLHKQFTDEAVAWLQQREAVNRPVAA